MFNGMEDWSDRLRRMRAATGLSQADVATALGIAPSSVAQWELGRSRPNRDRLTALSRLYTVSIDELTGMTGANAAAAVEQIKPNVRLATDAPRLPNFREMPRDIPVLGTAQGGQDGSFHLNREGEPIDWARRPPALENVKDVFSIYCEGDSMWPWREPGSLIYLSGRRHASIGSHVVVEVINEEPGEEPVAYVKRLIRKTAHRLVLAQYNPAKEIEFPAERVSRILRVLEWEEVLGI